MLKDLEEETISGIEKKHSSSEKLVPGTKEIEEAVLGHSLQYLVW